MGSTISLLASRISEVKRSHHRRRLQRLVGDGLGGLLINNIERIRIDVDVDECRREAWFSMLRALVLAPQCVCPITNIRPNKAAWDVYGLGLFDAFNDISRSEHERMLCSSSITLIGLPPSPVPTSPSTHCRFYLSYDRSLDVSRPISIYNEEVCATLSEEELYRLFKSIRALLQIQDRQYICGARQQMAESVTKAEV